VQRDGSMIDKVARVGKLYDFYATLLTDRQRKWVELHYLDDLSLAEIAEQYGVTRQAVHDNLKRAEEQLEGYDAHLGLIASHERRVHVIELLRESVKHVEKMIPPDDSAYILQLVDELSNEA
jgi:uncharacterized protein